MKSRLGIDGTTNLLAFLREAVDIMHVDPVKYGNCGHKIDNLLPTRTVHTFDMSAILADPEEPAAPTAPRLEDYVKAYPAVDPTPLIEPTVASPLPAEELELEKVLSTEKGKHRSVRESVVLSFFGFSCFTISEK